MKINGEEVELVTSFDQLRAGMIVLVTSCRVCGRSCRSMLLRLGEPREGAWTVAPACGPFPCFVTLRAVEERRVYRIVDPKLAQATARKREAVRT